MRKKSSSILPELFLRLLSARFRSRLARCDAWEAPGGNRGIVAVLIPGIAAGASFPVDHESCVGAAAVRSLPLAAFWCGERGCATAVSPQWKLGDQHGLPTLHSPVEAFGLAIP